MAHPDKLRNPILIRSPHRADSPIRDLAPSCQFGLGNELLLFEPDQEAQDHPSRYPADLGVPFLVGRDPTQPALGRRNDLDGGEPSRMAAWRLLLVFSRNDA